RLKDIKAQRSVCLRVFMSSRLCVKTVARVQRPAVLARQYSVLRRFLVSATHPTSNGNGTSQALYSSFRAFLEAERPAMAEALAREVVAYAPHYRAMTPEERLERLSANLGVFFDSLEERSGLTAWVESRTSTTVARGIGLGVTLQLLADYGRHFIDAALRAIDERVYGARE